LRATDDNSNIHNATTAAAQPPTRTTVAGTCHQHQHRQQQNERLSCPPLQVWRGTFHDPAPARTEGMHRCADNFGSTKRYTRGRRKMNPSKSRVEGQPQADTEGRSRPRRCGQDGGRERAVMGKGGGRGANTAVVTCLPCAVAFDGYVLGEPPLIDPPRLPRMRTGWEVMVDRWSAAAAPLTAYPSDTKQGPSAAKR